MEDNFQILDSEQGDIVIDFGGYILKFSQLELALSNLILKNGDLYQLNNELDSIKSRQLPSIKDSENWMNKGVDCQILKPGKNWQSGKFRIKVSLEFSPDEPEIEDTAEIEKIPEIKPPESPLDDLRRMINETTL